MRLSSAAPRALLVAAMPHEERAREILAKIDRPTMFVGGSEEMHSKIIHAIATALAERDREAEQQRQLYEDLCAGRDDKIAQADQIIQTLRAQLDALVEAVETALKSGGLTAYYKHMTWPAVKEALAAGKGEK